MNCPLFKRDFCLKHNCRYYNTDCDRCTYEDVQKLLEDEKAKKRRERDAEYDRYKTMSPEAKRALVRQRFPELVKGSGEEPVPVAAKDGVYPVNSLERVK